MKKSNKQLIFERMGLNYKPATNEDEFGDMGDVDYAERAGQGKGIINILINNIDEAMRYMDEMVQHSPELNTDIENIKKRLTLGLDNARSFDEGKEHKRKGNIKGMWGVDDDNDGLVDGSADGGFGGGDGGGE